MPKQARSAIMLLVAVAFGVALAQRANTVEFVNGATNGADYSIAGGEGPGIESEVRLAGLTFAPGVSELDGRAINEAIAGARPEARRLVDLVDGMTTVAVGPIDGGALGRAGGRPGAYEVTLDMPAIYRLGKRGISRVVLHELGHVVDFAILPDDIAKTLDAGIPPGWPCPAGGHSGSCAAVEERFAETFAKWATGDIGVDLYAGYAVPPPPLLDSWGAPLASLGA